MDELSEHTVTRHPKRRGLRRTAEVERGLRVIATIVANARAAIGVVDDPTEEEAIDAALEWIGPWKSRRAK